MVPVCLIIHPLASSPGKSVSEQGSVISTITAPEQSLSGAAQQNTACSFMVNHLHLLYQLDKKYKRSEALISKMQWLRAPCRRGELGRKANTTCCKSSGGGFLPFLSFPVALGSAQLTAVVIAAPQKRRQKLCLCHGESKQGTDTQVMCTAPGVPGHSSNAVQGPRAL